MSNSFKFHKNYENTGKILKFWFWFWFYYALWLASVFTLVLVLRQSSENRSITKGKQLVDFMGGPLPVTVEQLRTVTQGV